MLFKNDRIPRMNEYGKYLSEHINGVKDAFNSVYQKLLEDEVFIDYELGCISTRINRHDASKYEQAEYDAYLNHFYPIGGGEIPKNGEDIEFEKAWLHHQRNNSHHWQYYVLIRDGGEPFALDMSDYDIIEMLCDWHSFSRKNPESTAAYWYAKNGNKMILSDSTRTRVEMYIKYFEEPLK